jgi:hypothetical protein
MLVTASTTRLDSAAIIAGVSGSADAGCAKQAKQISIITHCLGSTTSAAMADAAEEKTVKLETHDVNLEEEDHGDEPNDYLEFPDNVTQNSMWLVKVR